MSDRKAELLNEVREIYQQYSQEVPGKRRPWPESIKQRVHELHGLGLNYTQIAIQAGISYFTVLGWKNKKTPCFDLVKVVPGPRKAQIAAAKACRRRKIAKVGTVTVPTAANTLPDLATVTVTIPNGVRIEGVRPDFLLQLLPLLGRTS